MWFWPFKKRRKVGTDPDTSSALPGWWSKKVNANSAEKCTNSDLALSIITAVQRVPKGEKIVLIVPEDNTDVFESLIRCGGEVHITLRAAPRGIIQLLTQESVGSVVPEGIVAKEGAIPGIDGTFFTGGN